MEGVVAEALAPMDQMAPAPTLGLLGQIPITADAEDDSPQQAQEQGLGGNLRVRPRLRTPRAIRPKA
jgi:hypothetical protein